MKTKFVIALVSVLMASASAHAAQLRRVTNVKGDFIMIGNTLGHDCGAGAPLVGTVTGCLDITSDATPNLHWRSDGVTATAMPAIKADEAASTAMLQVPPGAAILSAQLYWFGAAKVGDDEAIFERPSGLSSAVKAAKVHTIVRDETMARAENKNVVFYLSTADVTAFVQAQGNGAYRVSGVASLALDDKLFLAETGWTLVVFYALPTANAHNLALFDGIDFIVGPQVAAAELSGFTVPPGFEGKLGVVGIDGEAAGSAFRFGAGPTLTSADNLGDALNPSNFFFNGTHSRFGQAVSVAGDLPQMSGAANSGSGIDMDIVDISARLTAGQTSAKASLAPASNDGIGVLIWVTSISTYAPDFSDVTKTATIVGGGLATPGSSIEFAISATNSGNDTADRTLFTDALPPDLIYEPGSLRLLQSGVEVSLSDVAGDDLGEFNAAAGRISVRVGMGATATAGGQVLAGGAFSVRLRARIAPGTTAQSVQNQAVIEAQGMRAATLTQFFSDGDPLALGSQPTQVSLSPRQDGSLDAATDALSYPDVRQDANGIDSGGNANGPDAGLRRSEDVGCDCRVGTRGRASDNFPIGVALGALLYRWRVGRSGGAKRRL